MDTLRVSDIDRDAVAERLRVAYAEGRLTAPELNERLDAALSARTTGDLAPLTADLPADPRPAPPTPRPGPPAHRDARRGARAAWATWATAVSINLVVWLAVSVGSGGLAYFWPGWVAGPWGAVLLVSTVLGRGCTQQPERWSSTRPQACIKA